MINRDTREFIIKASNVFSHEDIDKEILEQLIRNKEINWEKVAKIAKEHRVSPAIYYTLNTLNLLELLESKVVTDLKRSYEIAYEENNKYFNEIARIFNKIKDKDMKVLLIKGEILSYNYYPDIATRPFGDCDLLLEKSQIKELEDILIENGYKQGYGKNGKILEATKRERYFAKLFMKHIIAYVKYDHGNLYVIEPHYNIFWRNKKGKPAFEVDMKNLIKSAIDVEFKSNRAWVMTNENFLMYMCIDIFEDANRIEKILNGTDIQLLKFLDVFSIINKGMDWDLFVEQISEWKMQLPVYYTLSALKDLYDIIPEEVIIKLKPSNLEYIDEFGFPEELVGQERCLYKKDFLARCFDHDYRLGVLQQQTALCKETTFQKLKNEQIGDAYE